MNILIGCGMDSSLNGFRYIADALEYIDVTEDVCWMSLYKCVGAKYGKSGHSVERDIRYAFETVRNRLWDFETVHKYIGLHNCSTSASLMTLYLKVSS